MIQQACEYISSILCTFMCFLNTKSPKIIKSDWGDWKRVGFHGNQRFYCSRCGACRTITLPSFNDLCKKFTEIGLFIYLMLFLGWMNDVISFFWFWFFHWTSFIKKRREIKFISCVQTLVLQALLYQKICPDVSTSPLRNRTVFVYAIILWRIGKWFFDIWA